METAATCTSERKAQWDEARRLWLGGVSANTARIYAQAWASFEASCKLEPWEVSRSDVARWVEGMRNAKLADATISLRIGALASFYRYTMEDYTATVNGMEEPLTTYNPAAGKSLRPKVSRFGKARSLTDDEARAILSAIKAAIRDSANKIQALRDYALFYGYLMTGRRNAEWRAARWEDFEMDGDVVWYRWIGKGEKGRLELPPPVWEVVKAYLTLTGRYESMRAEDYIFRGQATQGKPAPENAPIAENQVGRLLKKYCRRAGLNEKEIHVHSLRHTAARMRSEDGEGLEQLSHWMGHSSRAITEIYLQQVVQPRDTHWQKVSVRLGINTAEPPKKPGGTGTIGRTYRPYMRKKAK